MLSWMAWTDVTASFFAVIAGLLVIMTSWEFYRPSIERKGFLPIVTHRGDRLFIGLLTSAFIHLAAVGMTDVDIQYALGFSVFWVLILISWG
jgi:predicted small integral membrane protein